MSRVTLEDVARQAGVSVATVDRVLNGRTGVRAKTVVRVRDAIDALRYVPNRLTGELSASHPIRLAFVLPDGSNTFVRELAAEIEALRGREDIRQTDITLVHTNVFNALALAECLNRLQGKYDGVAVVALDHPIVREALESLSATGVPVVTLVSDVPNGRRAHYVGIDNTAAGRTAGTLVGRFVGGRPGKVGILAGSLTLRDHVERVFGFEQVIVESFPNLTRLPVGESQDEHDKAGGLVEKLLADHPDMIALYNAGAGNRGIVPVIAASGRARELVFIAHELTAETRPGLVNGTIDAIISQNRGHEARSALRILISKHEGRPIVPDQERIRIDIFMRDNLP